jgi:lipopolysaccharide transport system permease protein
VKFPVVSYKDLLILADAMSTKYTTTIIEAPAPACPDPLERISTDDAIAPVALIRDNRNGGTVSPLTDVLKDVDAELNVPPLSCENTVPAALAVTVVEPKLGWRVLDFGELWRCRELLLILTLRDIKVRYKQTALGAAWAIIQPLATMLVFSLFFGRVAANPGSGVPYSLFVLAGLVPWMFFSNAIALGSQSVIGNADLVTKIYFPRLLIPMAAVCAGLVDLAVAMGLLAAMILFFHQLPGWSLIVLPFASLGLVFAAVGVSAFLSALTVRFRDFRHVVPFLVQFWMFATPSVYMQTGIDSRTPLRHLLPLNPAYGLIANFRQAMLGGSIDGYSLAVSGIVSVVLFLFGCLYFRRAELEFADII